MDSFHNSWEARSECSPALLIANTDRYKPIPTRKYTVPYIKNQSKCRTYDGRNLLCVALNAGQIPQVMLIHKYVLLLNTDSFKSNEIVEEFMEF